MIVNRKMLESVFQLVLRLLHARLSKISEGSAEGQIRIFPRMSVLIKSLNVVNIVTKVH